MDKNIKSDFYNRPPFSNIAGIFEVYYETS